MVERHKLERAKQLYDESKSIIDELYMVAADDGEITKDEIELIKVIETSLNKFNKYLEEMLENEIIDDSKIEKLKELEIEINEHVQYQAIEDGKISAPESELMNSLFDALKSFNVLTLE